MKNRKDPFDLLGQVLKALLDESGVYSARREWAARLHVSEGLMSRWIIDKALIQPDTLETILAIIERDGSRAQKVLPQFWDAAELPPSVIAPSRGLRCSLGEWVARASKNRLMATLEGRDGFRQRLIAQFALKLELLGSKCDFELGEGLSRQLFHDLLHHYMEKMATTPVSKVQAGVALLAKQKRQGKVKTASDHTVNNPRVIPDTHLRDFRRSLMRGADVEAAMETAVAPDSGVHKFVPRNAKGHILPLAPQPIGGAMWQWHVLRAGESVANIVKGDEAIVLVLSGELKVTAEGHGDFVNHIGSYYVARLYRGLELGAYVFTAVDTTRFLVFSVSNSTSREQARSRRKAIPQVKVGRLDLDKIAEQPYTYKATRHSEVHATAYKCRDIGRLTLRSLPAQGALIHLQVVKVSSAGDNSLFERNAAYHYGFEFIVPIKGTVGLLFAEKSRAVADVRSAELRKFKDPGRVVLRAAGEGCPIPDIMAFDSDIPHTLYAVDNVECAYAVHIRFFGPEHIAAGDDQDDEGTSNVRQLSDARLAAGNKLSTGTVK